MALVTIDSIIIMFAKFLDSNHAPSTNFHWQENKENKNIGPAVREFLKHKKSGLEWSVKIWTPSDNEAFFGSKIAELKSK